MKKTGIYFLALLLLFSIAGCNSSAQGLNKESITKLAAEGSEANNIKSEIDGLKKVENLPLSAANFKESGNRLTLYVPAKPDQGFNWGYYLVLPSNNYKAENKDHKRYLMVDTNNNNRSRL